MSTFSSSSFGTSSSLSSSGISSFTSSSYATSSSYKDSSSSLSSSSCSQFSLEDINIATNYFDKERILGKGGEATVYKAELYLNNKAQKTLVAVKHLDKNSTEFEKEIQIVSKIQHPHVVALYGYCNESEKKILIYEYMKNGCLYDYVQKDSACLTWEQRLNICLGAAYGLQHLHKESTEFRKGIIHLDVKPANILLDENWVAKISDFGMFKLPDPAKIQSTIITGSRKGTAGYLAPEYCISRRITRRTDVYAFGVVLFEVLCRKTPWDRGDVSYYLEENEDWARENVDIEIKRNISSDSLMAYTTAIRNCLQENPKKHPTMDGVVQSLESAIVYQAHLCEDLNTDPSLLIPQFSREEINIATNNKERIVGRMDEATVYKAQLYLNNKTQKTWVAVKYLSKYSTEFEFEREIRIASKIQHPYVVAFHGYCNESSEKILIYEYMKNGNLSDYVRKSSVCLTWTWRLNICLGAAYGLKFLHKETTEYPRGIIHRDVKPANILLDENWVAKISDFGMSKFTNHVKNQSTVITGSTKAFPGYFPPEYYKSRHITRKIDAYAFGVVLFEVLCRKKHMDRQMARSLFQ